jgi:hypothetical protein
VLAKLIQLGVGSVKDHWLDLDAGIYSYQGVLWETCKTQKRIYELKDVSGSWMKNDRTHLLPLSRGGQEVLVKVGAGDWHGFVSVELGRTKRRSKGSRRGAHRGGVGRGTARY